MRCIYRRWKRYLLFKLNFYEWNLSLWLQDFCFRNTFGFFDIFLAGEGTWVTHFLHVSTAICCGVSILSIHAGHASVPSVCQRLRHHLCTSVTGCRPGSGIWISYFCKSFNIYTNFNMAVRHDWTGLRIYSCMSSSSSSIHGHTIMRKVNYLSESIASE